MGSFPGSGYYLHRGKETRTLFASFLKTADITPRVNVDDNEVQARVHQGAGGTYLWVTNPTMTARPVTVSLNPGLGKFSVGEDKWGQLGIKLSGQQVTVNVPARDTAVIALNAGGAVAFYPTQVPFHYRSKWLGNMDTFGNLQKSCRSLGMVVVARTDAHACHLDVYEAHPNWIMVDASGNKVRYPSDKDFWLTCPLRMVKLDDADPRL